MSEKDNLTLQGAGENTDELTCRLDAALAQLDAADADEVIRLAGGEAPGKEVSFDDAPQLALRWSDWKEADPDGTVSAVGEKKPEAQKARPAGKRKKSLPVLDNLKLQVPFSLRFDRKTLTEITFLDSLADVPPAWDFSEKNDGSVMAWTEGTHLFIAGKGGVALGEAASRLFEGMHQLRAVHCGCVSTSRVTDMSCMFEDCENLREADVGGWDTSRVTDMAMMFHGCGKLAALDVSRWDTSRVTDMAMMFHGCGKLAALDVSRWDTSRVTDMALMFCNCYGLAALDVSDWDTSHVTDMDRMFNNCCELAALDVSRWDTSRVTNMFMMFCDCGELAVLDVSRWDTSRANTDEMFAGTRFA